MRPEEGCQLPGLLVEWDLVIAFVGIEDGIPVFAGWQRRNLLPWSSFRVARSNAELVQPSEVDTESNLGCAILGHYHDWVQPVVGLWGFFNLLKNSSSDMFFNLGPKGGPR